MNTKLVLFDLDGVLVNACDWHYEALNLALKEIAGTEINRKEHEETFNGLPTLTKLDQLIKLGRVNASDKNKISERKQELTRDVLVERCKLDPEKMRVMSWLKDRNVTTMCVTNSIRDSAEIMLVKSGIREFLSGVVSNEDIANPKPNSEGYVTAMARAGVIPRDTVIVEDSPKGIQAASGLGATVIEVGNADDVTVELMRDRIK
jgi:HAD superfamily hydrolase (TIGR01509 family)